MNALFKKIVLSAITAFLTVLFVAIIFGVDHFVRTPLDKPFFLSDQSETIEVEYISWMCDCANFVQTKDYINNSIAEPLHEDYIFIEPLDSSLQLDSFFYDTGRFYYALKLTGQFYLDRGIPDSYEQKTPEKPELAKVFRYTHLEFIDKH